MTASEPTSNVFLHVIGGEGNIPDEEYIDLADVSDELLWYYTQQGNQRAATELIGRANQAEGGDKK